MSETSGWTVASAPGGTPTITSIFDFSAESLGQLKVYLEQAGLNLPISNIIGFKQFTVQASTAIADVSGTLAPGASATGAGPSIASVGVGSYLVVLSYNSTSSAAFAVSLATTVGASTITAYSVGPGNPGSTIFSVTKVGVSSVTAAGTITSTWATGNNGFGTNQNYGISNMQLILLKYANS